MNELEKVHDWNRRCPIGTTVRVQAGGGEIQVSTTRCEARLNSDQVAVVWLKGLIGPRRLDNLSVPGAEATSPSSVAPASSELPWPPTAAMRFEVVADPSNPDAWRVEAIDRNGTEQFYLAIFRGPAAEARASEYAAWKNREPRGR